MALPAPKPPADSPRRRFAVRGRSVAALGVATALLVAMAVLLPPIVPAGADLKDAHEASYARAIWPETQISLGVLMIFLPSLVYSIATRGAARGRLLIGAISLLGVAVATFYVGVSVHSYVTKPEVVYGFVTSLSGRAVCIEPFQGTDPETRCFALDVPSEELRGSANWVKEHRNVQMLVSRRGHVGFIAPVSALLE